MLGSLSLRFDFIKFKTTDSFNQAAPLLGRLVERDDPGVDDRLDLEPVDLGQALGDPSVDALRLSRLIVDDVLLVIVVHEGVGASHPVLDLLRACLYNIWMTNSYICVVAL